MLNDMVIHTHTQLVSVYLNFVECWLHTGSPTPWTGLAKSPKGGSTGLAANFSFTVQCSILFMVENCDFFFEPFI